MRIAPSNSRAGSVGQLVGGLAYMAGKKYIQRHIKTYMRGKLKRKHYYRLRSRKKRRGQRAVTANSSGTTHTTTRMIIRKTPRKQRFIRKLFRNNPLLTKHVNRFGFNWTGASAASKTIWYSVTHLKFNNVLDYMKERIIRQDQTVGSSSAIVNQTNVSGNNPASTIYIGKCTFSYEIYNPTNYIVTCYIYDLVCKHDTPWNITYSNSNEDQSSAPENCMQKGAEYMKATDTNPLWTVGDPTSENGTFWNTIGMKPTDYHLFNTLWKVKGMKKIILPPASSHHHVVVYNPKKKITLGGLLYPNEYITGASGSYYRKGLAGLTQSTLFGFEGQVAVDKDLGSSDNTQVGTLPGKMVVRCTKKVNVYNFMINTEQIISDSSLKDSWTAPRIFTDLIELPPEGANEADE